MQSKILPVIVAALATATPALAQDAGHFAFGPDQTLVDINQVTWAPLKLSGLPEGIEIATLHGDLAKGGGEILLRTPGGYTVPNHSHSSPEVYVWLQGPFTYVAADGTRKQMSPPVYISLPPNTPHALECGSTPCVFYLRYAEPFDLHVHPMPPSKG